MKQPHLLLLCSLAACAAPVSTTEQAVSSGTGPTLNYSRTRPPELASYPQLPLLQFTIHDDVTTAYLGGRFRINYRLLLQPLSDASGSPTEIDGSARVLPIATPVFGTPPPTPPREILFALDQPGLLAMSVYRMHLQLLDDAGAELGPESGWAYTVTGHTAQSPSTTLQLGRIDMVLDALVQLGDNEAGLIGKNGTLEADGWRFVSTDHPHYNPGDETGWCDWFYHYLGAIVTDGVDGQLAADPIVDGGTAFWSGMNPNNIPNRFRDPIGNGCGTELVDLDHDGTIGDVVDRDCQAHSGTEIALDADNRFYSNIPSNIYYDATQSLASDQLMGNYQAMDRHAGMFLAFDPNGDGTESGAGTIGTVWSIEGNVSDNVQVMHRRSDSTTINGFGKLTVTMFR